MPTLLAGLALAAVAARPAQAQNAVVKGHVNLPTGMRGERRFLGYWRVENGSVPVKTNAAANPPAVILDRVKGPAPAARTYSVKIAGFAADKGTLIVAPGSVLEITNGDKVPHDLSIPGHESLMKLERLSAGSMRRQKFPTAGLFEIRSARMPHLAIAVLVLDHPFGAVLDGNGDFKLTDVPQGKAVLRVFAAGRVVHEQSIDVAAGAKDLQVNVDAAAAGE